MRSSRFLSTRVADPAVRVTVTAQATWTLQLRRDYVDATVFGDTVRTYLVHPQAHPVLDVITTEGLPMRLNLMPWRRTAITTTTNTTEPEPIPATAEVDGNTFMGNLFLEGNGNRIRFAEYARASTGNTPAQGIVHQWNQTVGTTTDVQINPRTGVATFDAQLTREAYEHLREQMQRLNEMYANTDWLTGWPYSRNPQTTEERQQAEKRAERLLITHLDKDQLKEYKARGSFHVQGQKLTYRIHKTGYVGTEKPSGSFCIAPVGDGRWIPGQDQALSLKILIESDEVEFLRTANWSGADGTAVAHISLGVMDVSGKARNRRFEANLYRQIPA